MLTVYSKNNCPFCDKAKHLLKTKNVAFKELNIDADPGTRDWLIAQGHRSAPQIYLGDKLFVEGGYQGLAKLSDEEINERLGELNVSSN
jgi:glutaredoxin|tara:strand:+ start:1933 stop:2199 length:267 start_codon:yes stop_codon:yes gene_type:complete